MFSPSVRSSKLRNVLLVGATVLPVVVRAQGGALPGRVALGERAPTILSTLATADVARAAGPRMAFVGVIRLTFSPRAIETRMRSAPHVGMGSTLALVGAGVASLVVGLLVGGDAGTVLAVSGGAISFVGLYRYLR